MSAKLSKEFKENNRHQLNKNKMKASKTKNGSSPGNMTADTWSKNLILLRVSAVIYKTTLNVIQLTIALGANLNPLMRNLNAILKKKVNLFQNLFSNAPKLFREKTIWQHFWRACSKVTTDKNMMRNMNNMDRRLTEDLIRRKVDVGLLN